MSDKKCPITFCNIGQPIKGCRFDAGHEGPHMPEADVDASTAVPTLQPDEPLPEVAWPQCAACEGSGKRASNGEPWTKWKDRADSLPIRAGIIKAVDCGECGGTGHIKPFLAYCIDVETQLEKSANDPVVTLPRSFVREMMKRGKEEILEARAR